MLGFLGGAAVGALAGFVIVQSQGGANSSTCTGNENPCTLIYLLTLPAGAVLGSVVGAVVGGEHWKTTPMPARLSVGSAGSGRWSFGLSVGF